MLSLPIINGQSTAATRPAFLHELRRAGVDRVFICPGNPFGDEERIRTEMALLTENINFYKENGYEVGVWIGGLGHGGTLAHEHAKKAQNFTLIVGLGNGGTSSDSFCPTDPEFYGMYKDYIRHLALAGAPMIMIDDDLRIALHGAVGLGCACERHLAMFNERVNDGHTYTREELAAVLFTGPATPLRKVWLDLMGDTMRDFARGLREVVDSVDPSIRLGHCACLPTWDIDGIDSIEMAKIFAGNTRPFLRLIGAPYWTDGRSFHTTGTGSIIDIERMQLSWCREIAPEVEVFTEGDVYTRPRYNVPATYLEGFDQVLNAENTSDGILKYMIDYSYHPYFETGYIDRHVYNKPLRDAQTEAFHGKETVGVYVYEVMHKLADLDCTGLSEGEIIARFTPASVNFANATSLPIAFKRNDDTNCALIFGENAKYADENLLKMPLILDLTAARILTARGLDVGLAASENVPAPGRETFPDWHPDGGETLPTGTGGRFAKLTPADGAEVLNTFMSGGESCPMAYTYENADGGRFLVYAFDAESIDPKGAIFRGYPRQKQLFRAITWLQQGKPLPASVMKEPGLYVLCKRHGDELAVGIWNLWHDLGMPKEIPLDGAYSEIRGIGDTKVTLDGDTVRMDTVIPPYGFAGFVVKK